MADYCNDLLILPPEDACAEYAPDLIEGVYYAKPSTPIVVPSGVGTYEARFATELARRLALNDDDDDKIFYLPTKNATMPFGTAVTKIDPHNNVQIVSKSETDMAIEGVEYRNNDTVYNFWAQIAEEVRNYTAWFKQGNKVWGAEAGFNATFSASAGILSGNNMPNQINYRMNWKGSTMPARVSLP